jgi:hypothetical protein
MKCILIVVLLVCVLILPVPATAAGHRPMIAPNGVGPLTSDPVTTYLTVSSSQLTQSALAYELFMEIEANYPISDALIFVDTNLQVDTQNGAGTIQVGLWQSAEGLSWYAYADDGIACYRGTRTFGGYGCLGTIGDLGATFGAEVVAQINSGSQGQNIWYLYFGPDEASVAPIAAVYDPNTHGIYAARAVAEEQWFTADLGQEFLALIQHPQFTGLTGSFQPWPPSGTGAGNNFLLAQANICPSLYSAYLISGDHRAWLVGNFAVPPASCMYNPLF